MFKNLQLKALSSVALIAGNVIGKKRRIPAEDIKSILVNRTDRLGDAAASLPFLLELKKRFSLKVLTSRYNDPVLKGLVDTHIFTEAPSSVHSAAEKIIEPAGPAGRYDLYLDLVGISGVDASIRVKESGLCRYYAGFNLGPWNRLLDYADEGNPVLFSKKHVLESYRLLLKESCGIDIDIPDTVNLDGCLIKPDDFKTEPPYILVNISGAERFRGPSPELYAMLLERLDFKGNIVIMDGPGRPNLETLKNSLNRSKVIFTERDYSAWELAYIAKGSLLYIGPDCGITQLLSWLTNCLVFFASGSPDAWKPYSKNKYSIKIVRGTAIEETKSASGFIKKAIYIDRWCRPCFDLGCRDRLCIKGIDIQAASEEVDLMLKQIPQKI